MKRERERWGGGNFVISQGGQFHPPVRGGLKSSSHKLKGNTIIFAQKLTPRKTLDIIFKSKIGQYYF